MKNNCDPVTIMYIKLSKIESTFLPIQTKCVSWADPEGGTGGPDPPTEKSQKYRVS